MRENERRIGGLHWGIFSIFEPSEPRPDRVIDQSMAAWRLASKNNGGAAAFENPRSVIQRTVNMVACGSNREHRVPELQYSFSPHIFSGADVVDDAEVPVIYRRERTRFIPDMLAARPYDPEELAYSRRPRMMTAEQVRAQVEEHRRQHYPTPEEVEQIQRQFHNPEFEDAMELARQEMARCRVCSIRLVRNPDGSFEPHVD